MVLFGFGRLIYVVNQFVTPNLIVTSQTAPDWTLWNEDAPTTFVILQIEDNLDNSQRATGAIVSFNCAIG